MGCKCWGSMDVVLWCIIVLSLSHVSMGLEHKPLKWEVEYMHGAPDCQEHVVMGINGQFPGPTIRAKAGVTIDVDLVNKLHNEGVPGTYFYHGHYGMQRSEGLYGSLIVDIADGKKEPFRYDDDRTQPIVEGPNLSVHQLANASSKEKNNAHPQSWNKTYRLRIASTTALASLLLAIEDHNVTVVEGDGNCVQPNQTLSKVKDLPTCEPPKTPQWNDYDRSKAFTKSIFVLQDKDRKP
ncbi:hypothetical protein Golob_013872, partial [Gossypium lobatum]|nr:hypothetical protein [Gossypium lobatum]